ncbi:MAG: hypothetical protein GEU88_06525 [Solirubrobacterales bacterium]|nr:hypothetical protein [Solirubrobacterales bacterium]
MSEQAPQGRRDAAPGSQRRQNAELLREGIDAFNRGDHPAVTALFDERVECRVGPGLVNTGVWYGHDGYLEMITAWGEAWREIEMQIAAVEVLDDRHLIAEIDQRAVGAASGAPVEMTVYGVLEVRDGLAVRFHLYPDREAALAAATRS